MLLKMYLSVHYFYVLGFIKKAGEIFYSIRIQGTSLLEVNPYTFLSSRIRDKKLGFRARRPFSP